MLAGIAAFAAWSARSTPASGGLTAPPVATTVSSGSDRAPAVETPQAVESGDEVWRQLARGDRAGVLARLGTAGHAPGDGALASAVIDTVRATVLRTRESASSGSGASSETYRAGEQQLARANRLAAAGQPVESLRALWQAADLYTRSLAAPVVPVTVPAAPRPPTPGEPAIASSNIPSSNLPQPVPEVVAAPLPAPAAAPPAALANAGPAVVPNPAPPQAPSDSEAILETLRRYDAAYQSLDVAALLKVYPSLGGAQVDQLRRTFAGMTAYEMDTRVARVNVTGDAATVAARVARRMSPRVGRPVVNEVETEFRLQRAGAGWVIVSVAAR